MNRCFPYPQSAVQPPWRASSSSTAVWTDARCAELKRLWTEGFSASQIAAQLGGVSRNAVISKLHRSGLTGRGQPSFKTQRRTKSKTLTDNSLRMRIRRPQREVREPVVVPIKQDISAPEAKRLSIFQLTERTCKWPHGDPRQHGFHFCGHPSEEGAPYCGYHCGVAYLVKKQLDFLVSGQWGG